MKKTLFLILLLGLFLTGCAKENNLENQENQKTSLANPASVYCEEHGGELEIREGDEGQFGVCKLSNGVECEEWAFYRGECGSENESISEENKGEEKKTEPTVSTGNKNIKVFNITENQVISSPITISGEGSALENSLIVELRNKDHKALVQEPVNIKSQEAGKSGPFEITLHFQFSGTDEGFIAVYEKDINSLVNEKSELNLIEIPVKFATSTPEN